MFEHIKQFTTDRHERITLIREHGYGYSDAKKIVQGWENEEFERLVSNKIDLIVSALKKSSDPAVQEAGQILSELGEEFSGYVNTRD